MAHELRVGQFFEFRISAAVIAVAMRVYNERHAVVFVRVDERGRDIARIDDNRLALIVHTGAGAPFALPSLYMPAARKFADLKLILAHCGGGLYAGEAIVAALFCANIYLELSSLMPHHIAEVMNHVPATRLMIGSDLPVSQEAEIGKILSMPMDAEDKSAILFETAATVFG